MTYYLLLCRLLLPFCRMDSLQKALFNMAHIVWATLRLRDREYESSRNGHPDLDFLCEEIMTYRSSWISYSASFGLALQHLSFPSSVHFLTGFYACFKNQSYLKPSVITWIVTFCPSRIWQLHRRHSLRREPSAMTTLGCSNRT